MWDFLLLLYLVIASPHIRLLVAKEIQMIKRPESNKKTQPENKLWLALCCATLHFIFSSSDPRRNIDKPSTHSVTLIQLSLSLSKARKTKWRREKIVKLHRYTSVGRAQILNILTRIFNVYGKQNNGPQIDNIWSTVYSSLEERRW